MRSDHGGDGVLVGDIGGDGDCPDAPRLELGDRRIRLRLIAADDGDIGAGVGQSLRHAEANAAIAAGDDRYLAPEIERTCLHG